MKVLVITGDRSFKSGNPRFDLQSAASERFEILYWGKGAVWPKIPEGEFDVVTTQDPFFRGLVGLFIARKLKARLNVQLHADLQAQSFLKRLVANFVLSRADSIRVVSEMLRKQIGKVKAKIVVLPVFVELDRFKNLERNPDENPTILWIGRFEGEKDPVRAISVFKEVLKDMPSAKLVMLGAGSLEGELKGISTGLAVEFPGWQDPVEFLQKASVLLSTSKAESWGSSIVESLAAGVPVVAPDVGVAKEAGAFVVPREKLAEEVIKTIKEKREGKLLLQILSKEEWVKLWKESL